MTTRSTFASRQEPKRLALHVSSDALPCGFTMVRIPADSAIVTPRTPSRFERTSSTVAESSPFFSRCSKFSRVRPDPDRRTARRSGWVLPLLLTRPSSLLSGGLRRGDPFQSDGECVSIKVKHLFFSIWYLFELN